MGVGGKIKMALEEMSVLVWPRVGSSGAIFAVFTSLCRWPSD